MSKGSSFSLSTLTAKGKRIFLLNRSSAIEKLKKANLSTTEYLEALQHIFTIEEKAMREAEAMKTHVALKLEKEDFGVLNMDLDNDDLELLVNDTQIFSWLKGAYPHTASKMQAGLVERYTRPKSDAERVRELEEQLRQVIGFVLKPKNQRNEQKRPTYKRPTYKLLTYTKGTSAYKPPHKKQKVSEPPESSVSNPPQLEEHSESEGPEELEESSEGSSEESSEGEESEESDGRNDNGNDNGREPEDDDYLFDSDLAESVEKEGGPSDQ
ncbi:hypothetical protein HK104_007846, partial [Borealophlyctis nickersoniae]